MRGRTFPWSRPTNGARPSANTLARLGVFAILICLLAAAFNFGSAAKSAAVKRAAAAEAPRAAAPVINHVKEVAAPSALSSVTLPLVPAPVLQAQPSAPSIETYNCTTLAAQEVFNLNDHVCARATGVPPAAFPEFQWRVSWVDPGGLIEQKDFAEVDTTTAYDYQLPSDDTSNRGVEDGIVVNNRGTWRVNLTRASGAIYATASFTVRGNTPVSDVYVQKFIAGAAGFVNSGSPVKFIVVVANAGPNSAANVLLADSAPTGSSLASFSQVSGPQCLPADSPNCTVSSLDSGGRAEFEAVYIAGGTPGTAQTSATVTTDTAELSTDNNTATAQFEVTSGGGGSSCVLVCPNDMVVAASSFQGTTHGAVVNFGNAEHFGTCGTVTANPISGSFFPVGTNGVSISSSEGGGSCSFTITVTEEPPPDISCPAPVTVEAESGCSAEVSAANLGTPTTTGGRGTVTVEAVRSDSKPLGDPYPVGTTTITYTATDSIGSVDSCTQTVTVTVAPGNDTEPPTITAPPALTLSTGSSGGSCGLVVSEATLGAAQAADDGCTVTVTRTGVPAGNFFPVGQTTVTWTATDAAGKTATATQIVTVTEDTPPSIQAPPDASYTCASEVPAANPSQANGGDPNQPGGGPVTDNCGVPTVGVTESRSGVGSASSPLIITRTFTATDASGNTASSVQTITVVDDTPPTFALVGPASVTHECHTPFTDPGVTTPTDNCNAQVTVTTSNGFNPDVPGTYTITYTATDGVGNTTSVQRTVTVVDTTAPVITLDGANPMTVECHTPFTDPGATASDSCDSNVPVSVSGSVNADVPGTYVLTYNASDDSGNAAATKTRTVTVVDTIAPVITVSGANPATVECHTSYTDAGATAADACDASVPVSTSGSVNVNVPGTYTLTYTASDDSGNAATPVTRTVNVVDTTPPVITTNGSTPSLWPANHKYVSFQVTSFVTGATDSCDTPLGVSSVKVEKVTSDETENGNGDGNTTQDILIGADCKSFQVRAERQGNGNGRVYTVTFIVRDASGNVGRATAKIVVQHNPGESPVDSGAHYTVTGNCP